MKKKILLVSYHMPPVLNAESILVWKTIRELSLHYDIDVLTARGQRRDRTDAQMSLPANVHVVQSRAWKPWNALASKALTKGVGYFADETYLWTMQARANFALFRHCDVIYSRSQPAASHILAYQIRQKLRKPWVAQFSDPWTNNPYHQHHSPFRKAYDRLWERRVIQHADVLIFPTKEILGMYTDTYKTNDITRKSLLLPHHYVPELFQAKRNKPADGKSPVTFAYFGDFYGKRSPAPFLAGLREVIARQPHLADGIQVRFFGNVEQKFTDMLAKSPLPVQQAKVSYFESLQRMAESDVLLLIDAPSANGINPFLASKLIDYLGAGKPILGITDLIGTASDILRKYGHHVVSPHDQEGIASAILECLSNRDAHFMPPVEFTTEAVIGRLAEKMAKL
ncbi:glycosyltransferase [Alicyclobacillus fodiniaquatilis]|uniref:Glycosyltransferase n=1 Tax=Alicyclobacillus fodiniaquatilis TaxID=1661150 RepID=A0ABW4JBP2_9BACL